MLLPVDHYKIFNKQAYICFHIITHVLLPNNINFNVT